VASSAYQTEGAWNQSSKGPSVWDAWYLSRGSPNAFTAIDGFRRMQSDVDLLATLKPNLYRFSVAWTRLVEGCSGLPNLEGVAFYKKLIDKLKANGIEPVITLWHWDTPQECEDQYGSWTNKTIVNDFVNYADIVFRNFGQKVKYFLTLNEPNNLCGRAYGKDDWAPGKNILKVGQNKGETNRCNKYHLI
jgi:6-phospho-beta-glucosidase